MSKISEDVLNQLRMAQAEIHTAQMTIEAMSAMYQAKLAQAVLAAGYNPQTTGAVCLDCGLIRDRSSVQEGKVASCDCAQA